MKVKIIECLSDADLAAFANLGAKIRADLAALGIAVTYARALDAAAFVKEIKSAAIDEDVVVVAHANQERFALPDGTRTLWESFGQLVGAKTLENRRLFLAACAAGMRTAPARLLFQAGWLQQVIGPYEKANRASVLIAVAAFFGGILRGESLTQIGAAMNIGSKAGYRVYDRISKSGYRPYPEEPAEWVDRSSGKAVKRPVKKVNLKP